MESVCSLTLFASLNSSINLLQIAAIQNIMSSSLRHKDLIWQDDFIITFELRTKVCINLEDHYEQSIRTGRMRLGDLLSGRQIASKIYQEEPRAKFMCEIN